MRPYQLVYEVYIFRTAPSTISALSVINSARDTDPTTTPGADAPQPVLSPTFADTTYLYTLNVPQFTTSVEFLILVDESNTVFVNDITVAVSDPVPTDEFNYRSVIVIAPGVNVQTVELKPTVASAVRKLLGEEGLTAAGGSFYKFTTTRPYTGRLDAIVVTALAGNGGASFAVNPTFGTNTYVYTVSVDPKDSIVNIAAIYQATGNADDGNVPIASVVIDGEPMDASGSEKQVFVAEDSSVEVTISVTSTLLYGSTLTTYKLTVVRGILPKMSEVTLTSDAVNGGVVLSPPFKTYVYDYTIVIPETGVTYLDLDLSIVAGTGYTIEVNGVSYTVGDGPVQIPMPAAPDPIDDILVKVTDPNVPSGDAFLSNSYVFKVTRADLPELADVVVSGTTGASLNPPFAADTNAYDLAIPTDDNSVCLTFTLNGRAVQVDPIQPRLKPPGIKRLKLNCDVLLSTSAFKCHLRRYTMGRTRARSASARACRNPSRRVSQSVSTCHSATPTSW